MKRIIILLIVLLISSCGTYNYKYLDPIEKKEVISSSIFFGVAGCVVGYMAYHEINK